MSFLMSESNKCKFMLGKLRFNVLARIIAVVLDFMIFLALQPFSSLLTLLFQLKINCSQTKTQKETQETHKKALKSWGNVNLGGRG